MYVHILATHTGNRRHVCTHLYRKFVMFTISINLGLFCHSSGRSPPAACRLPPDTTPILLLISFQPVSTWAFHSSFSYFPLFFFILMLKSHKSHFIPFYINKCLHTSPPFVSLYFAHLIHSLNIYYFGQKVRITKTSLVMGWWRCGLSKAIWVAIALAKPIPQPTRAYEGMKGGLEHSRS